MTMKRNDQKTLFDCSLPRPAADVYADWEAFCEAVYALRVQHRIPDLVVAARLNLSLEDREGVDEDNGMYFARFGAGDSLHHETLAAWLFGQLQAERQSLMASALSDGGRVLKQQKTKG